MIRHVVAMLVVIAALLTSAMSPVFAESKRETVFRDLAWGDPPSALGDANLIERDGPLVIYNKANDMMTIGALRLQSINYVFFNDRLTAIWIIVYSPSEAERILRAKYGRPFSENMFMVDLKWRSGDTLIGLKERLFSGTAEWVMFSVSIWDEYEAWLKQQATKAADMF